MLENTKISPPRRANSSPVIQRQDGDNLLRPLIERLRLIGFQVPPLCGAQGNVAGGVPMRISIRDLLRSGPQGESTLNTVLTLLRDQVPLTLSLTELGRGDSAIDGLQRLCQLLQAEIATQNLCGEHLGVCVHSHQLPLQALHVFAKSFPGNGPRYVFLDDMQMTPHSNRQMQSETDQNWSVLWRSRLTSVPLKPAYGASVRTACSLLADEDAAAVLPVCGIQVPVDSAWLPMSLSLTQFANDAGEIRWNQLLPALASGVDIADEILNQLCWSQSGQRTDARLNRRLAMSITGLGNLVARRGLDPENLATLRWLSAIVVRIRTTMWHRSGQLARNFGCLPALCNSDPSSGWDDSAERENWRRHWRAALEKAAVRHRNMLILSAYSVLPSNGACSAGYTDLLPVVACADAWSFADVPQFSGWSLSEYKVFHRRAWAVIQGRNTGSLVAAGV